MLICSLCPCRIHPNLRLTVYCNAIAAGGEEEWRFAWEQFQKSSIATEAEKLRSALACTKQPWLLNRSAHTLSHHQNVPRTAHHKSLLLGSIRYLTYTLDPQKIRKQDATSTIVYIANNVVGQSLAWDFVRAEWEYIFTQ